MWLCDQYAITKSGDVEQLGTVFGKEIGFNALPVKKKAIG